MNTKQIDELKWCNLVLELKSLLKNMVNNSAYTKIDISDKRDIEIITNGTPFLMLTANGEEAKIKLPKIQNNEGRVIFITNDTQNEAVVTSLNGGDDIWEGGMSMNETSIPQGTVMRLINDSLKWRVL